MKSNKNYTDNTFVDGMLLQSILLVGLLLTVVGVLSLTLK